jgi:hypothetical protein
MFKMSRVLACALCGSRVEKARPKHVGATN